MFETPLLSPWGIILIPIYTYKMPKDACEGVS